MKEEPYTDKRVSLTKKTIHAKDMKYTLPGEVKEKYERACGWSRMGTCLEFYAQ